MTPFQEEVLFMVRTGTHQFHGLRRRSARRLARAGLLREYGTDRDPIFRLPLAQEARTAAPRPLLSAVEEQYVRLAVELGVDRAGELLAVLRAVTRAG